MGAGGVGDDAGKGKRKRTSVYIQGSGVKDETKRTRVHAQRKFAQGVGVSPQASPMKENRTRTAAKTDNGSSSSSSSGGAAFSTPKGECPKTEDFLTFLCLRGTDLLPPELDFFNQASSVGHTNDSSEDCSSDQDNVSKDPEVDKNGVARKSSKRLLNSKFKKETSPSLKKRENVESKRDIVRKTRSQSQDSHSSPERRTEGRQTRSQGEASKVRVTRAARKNGRGVESSDDSLSDNEVEDGFEAEVDADEEASSRESSRRPMTRKSEDLKLKSKSVISKLKQREARSTSRDSSVSKESIKTPAGKSPAESKNEVSVKDKESEKEEQTKDDPHKSPKDKREAKKKNKNKSKTSLKDLQNILLEEAKRKIAADVPRESGDGVQETSETSSVQPSCSPADSDTPDSEERITISHKTGYISVKSRNSTEAEDVATEAGRSPQRRDSGPYAGPGGKKMVKAGERVPTPPRKILPKNEGEAESPVSRTNHLPVGVIGAAGLSTRLTHPVALSKSSPVTSANFSQPLVIQTQGAAASGSPATSSQAKPPPTIIVPSPAPAALRMPLQMSACVPLQAGAVRPMAAVPILAASQFPQLPTQPAPRQPVVTVPTFVRSAAGYGYTQPLVASVAPGQLPQPQTIRMPSGTTIQYNVPSSSIRHNNPAPATKISAVAAAPLPVMTPSHVMTGSTSPLVSPGPPTLSPQIPSLSPQVAGGRGGATTVTRTVTTPVQEAGAGPPVLTPPVRPDTEPRARRELLPQPLAPALLSHEYHSPPHQHQQPSPGYPLASPPLQVSQVSPYPPAAAASYPPSPQVQYSYPTSQSEYPHQQQPSPHHAMLQSPQPPSEPASLHSPLTHSSAQYSGSKKNRESMECKSQSAKDDVTIISDARSESSESSTSSTKPIKKNGDKMLKSKFGNPQNRPTKTFDMEDNSSPYAFDFEDGTPNMPFRKSSSPLKPPAMIKKSLMAGKAKKQQQQPVVDNHESSSSPQTHADLKPTGSKHKITDSQKSPRLKAELDKLKQQVSVDYEVDNVAGNVDNVDGNESKVAPNPEDTSSSDNDETTYFIPLKNSSGQSFGVALKLGTDGPCGPNQKVIMTAKLVTDPQSKPTKAKILGAKTTETALPARDTASPVASTSTPIKETLTPRKMMIPNSSPVATEPKSRIRRALSPDPSPAPAVPEAGGGASSKDTSLAGGKRRPMCLMGTVHTGHRFPRLGQHAQMMEAPTFRPTEAEFKDPLKYIQKIRSYAEQFGMCRIIPPSSFKPECNVDDDMRFTAYNQYVHRMMSRAGPNSKETAAIKKYLETQNCDTRNHPLVGGLEVDLPALYHAVQSFGGLSEVIQKKKWNKIADYMRVARGTNVNAAANKLDDIYVKWLLPYDTLSNVEREELIRLVEEEWAEKAEKSRVKEEVGSDDEENEEDEEEDEDQEAVVKGKSTSLTQFYRVAKNLMSSIFRSEDPPHHIVEDEYWKIVADKDVHLQVCQGSIDTGNEGYGFPIRNSPFSSHPWNLKQLTNNPRSVLRAMGKVMGVTQPTLHVGMLFTTGCWYRDPHGLPWVEFLHTGAPKIWYGIPDDHSLAFYTAMKQLVPSFCKNRKIWLPSDTTMVSPSFLVKHGVSVCRAVQQPGQFVVVFPRSYTSSLCTGYNVSESVYYAPAGWLADVDTMFQDIKDSQEPMMFPLEKILFALATDSKATRSILEIIKPKIAKIREREMDLRKKVMNAGVKTTERLQLENKSSKDEEDEEYECFVCNANLYVSLVANENEEVTYCLPHGLEYLKENKNKVRHCKLLYTHTLDEIKDILSKVELRLKNKNYAEEHDEDIPLKEEDIEDIEDEDYIHEDHLKPRDRALPSYIKKEKKPLISSESEDEEEEPEEEVDSGPKITADDYLDDDFDPAVIAALFAEDDEVVRSSGKRKAPKERKVAESSDTSEEDEESEDAEETSTKKTKSRSETTAKKKDIEKSKSEAKTRAKDASTKKEKAPKEKEKSKPKAKNIERQKPSKRKLEESSSSSPKKKSKDVETTFKKVPTKATKDGKGNPKNSPKKPEDNKRRPVLKEEVSKSKKKVVKTPPKEVKKKEEPKKSANTRSSKEEKPSSKTKKEASKDDKGKQRRSKKRKAKSMDAADKFNLLDIILTETDDENYCSASDKDSKESSSDDEWK